MIFPHSFPTHHSGLLALPSAIYSRKMRTLAEKDVSCSIANGFVKTVQGCVYVNRGRCERRHTMLILVWIALLLLIVLGTFISTQLYTSYTDGY
jgi:hypothetical protein